MRKGLDAFIGKGSALGEVKVAEFAERNEGTISEWFNFGFLALYQYLERLIVQIATMRYNKPFQRVAPEEVQQKSLIVKASDFARPEIFKLGACPNNSLQAHCIDTFTPRHVEIFQLLAVLSDEF